MGNLRGQCQARGFIRHGLDPALLPLRLRFAPALHRQANDAANRSAVGLPWEQAYNTLAILLQSHQSARKPAKATVVIQGKLGAPGAARV